jgi:hypothetical protein
MNGQPKKLIGTCGDNPFIPPEAMDRLVENAQEIGAEEFIGQCELEEERIKNMAQQPNDYRFFKNGDIYFYEWSAIEHFFK